MEEGTFFFSYLADFEAFDADRHARFDEEIFSLSISQEEGGESFASATLEVIARAESYIKLGRRAAVSVVHDGHVVPLIVGTITAVPRGLAGEVVQLEMISKPGNWQSQLHSLVESLAVAPHFDPLFSRSAARREPDEVLTGYNGRIGWDRVTETPYYSDSIAGEEVIEFPRISRDGVSIEVEGPPVTAVEVEVAASWQQDASVISEVSWAHDPRVLEVVAEEALEKAWPKEGTDIGGGWVIERAELSLSDPEFRDLGEISGAYDNAVFSGDVPVYRADPARITLRNARAQARTEIARVRVSADVQGVMTPGEESESISLNRVIGEADDVSPWQPLADYAIGDVVFYSRRLYECVAEHAAKYVFDLANWSELDQVQGRIDRSFFQTDRGSAAVAHAVERARARLLEAARCVRITFDVPLEDALNVSTRASTTISDPRIPGGSATGKIVSYELRADGEGSRWATIEMMCAAGRGGSRTPVAPFLQLTPPTLGPEEYPATGSVTPTAAQQIAELREAPDAYNLSVRVQIDAAPVPSTNELRHSLNVNAGHVDIPAQVQVE